MVISTEILVFERGPKGMFIRSNPLPSFLTFHQVPKARYHPKENGVSKRVYAGKHLPLYPRTTNEQNQESIILESAPNTHLKSVVKEQNR